VKKLAKKVSIFDFVDYRLFLKEYYRWNKTATRGFSHRLMAHNLGFTSTNFLKLVMDGKRNLSRESLEKITTGLDLNKKEVEYFSYLVFFSQAKTPVDKNYFFGLLAAMRGKKNIASLTPDQFEYFSEWYHPVVRELVAGKSDPLDFDALSSGIRWNISVSKIRKSVEVLKRLGLIALDGQRRYVSSSPLINTDNELNSFAVRRYHKEVLGVAQKLIDEAALGEREYSHLTVKVSPDGFAKIKQRLQDFRAELLEMVSLDRDALGVYHVNFQFYPITKSAAE
jgi:uncharacterized protein (TIGR02147 family)